jgi:hypothetical protein
MPCPTADIGWPFVKISASGPDADLQVLRPGALLDQHALQLRRLRAARHQRADVAAELGLHALRIASAFSGEPRACSSMTRSSIDRERNARRLDGLQIVGRQQPRLACIARGLRCIGENVFERADAWPLPSRTMAAGLSASHRSRMVAARREMSCTPSARTATTAGPPASGSQTRAGQRTAGAILRQRNRRRHVIGHAHHGFPCSTLS